MEREQRDVRQIQIKNRDLESDLKDALKRAARLERDAARGR